MYVLAQLVLPADPAGANLSCAAGNTRLPVLFNCQGDKLAQGNAHI
jgi:hypothetical protein